MPHGDPTKPFTLRLDDEERAAYERTAAEAGLTLSEWARKVLNAAAHAPARPDRKVLRRDAALEGVEQDALRIIERARKARG